MKGTLTIDTPMSEVEFIEACLNQTASGQDMLLPFLLYALKQRMHIDVSSYFMQKGDEEEWV